MGKLKTRLILAFLSIILLPILTTGATLALQSSNIEAQEERVSQSHQQVEEWVNQELAENEISHVDFNGAVREYSTDIVIKNTNEEVIYQSSDEEFSEGSMENLPPHSFSVTAGDGTTYNVEVRSQIDLTQQILQSIFISLGVGLVTLILLITLWTWYIARTILLPLREIYIATEEVKEGNLDYPLQYKKKDEIGRFVGGFNNMRLHLKQLREEQQQYEDSRKQLIASISHDLRTPLASIKGYVEGLQDGVADTEEKQQKYYQVINRKTDQLDRLIEDLFKFSKMELQQFPVNQKLIDSRDFLKDVLEEIETEMDKKDTHLIVQQPIPSVTLSIDPDRIVQVITNITENAIRYGAEHLTVSVEINENGEYQISFQDDGSGIGENELDKIFDQFYRGEKSRSRELGGSGLGLSIAQSIMNQHSGRIEVQSKHGQGSTFIVILPIKGNS
ncbi:sensor histidine kinase [Halalkalibacillus sediminis]|uniref:histidine kinase n=1 Tax=Halalkalibacillus sediminis TaxID=2018042 RepID=A0A2I0QR55_9BACI|nr:ATP-binding protein [Halalkalibacillus sediminis]PKR76808.1 sensor histidine kinase [Halalkalibacillus sediminis]